MGDRSEAVDQASNANMTFNPAAEALSPSAAPGVERRDGFSALLFSN